MPFFFCLNITKIGFMFFFCRDLTISICIRQLGVIAMFLLPYINKFKFIIISESLRIQNAFKSIKFIDLPLKNLEIYSKNLVAAFGICCLRVHRTSIGKRQRFNTQKVGPFLNNLQLVQSPNKKESDITSFVCA